MSDSSDIEEQIFSEALALPADERPPFLDGACRGDGELRQRIESLVGAFEAAGGFMCADRTIDTARIMGDYPSPPTSAESPGDWIGRYKLLQQLGEGGCGVVWMAEQEEPVRRRVAVKIIKLGMDTSEVIARFEAERQALAMMDHPNIAKILDAGSSDAGRPFFVMELVRGVKVTEYCDQYSLTTHQRLALFSQICHAVQHAHQKGIIHRDLKPSNILVTLHDGLAVPKIIDFGIAKATEGRLTDRTLFTAFEQFMGTPAYMSPEQAELGGIDIDTRSDIYSLGVLLYELLTGRPPFDPKTLLRSGLDEIRRIIREVDPPKPSAHLSTLAEADRLAVARLRGTDPAGLSLRLRGDLDWIVMRCLEKNRTRRYETPAALAADIARHLNNEPVTASPPSRAYRLGKMVRRHRLACAAGAGIALALVAGSVVSTWQAVRATRAERLAREERRRAVDERTQAENLLNFMLGDLYTQLDRVGRLDVLEAVAAKAAAYFAAVSPADLNDATQLARAKAQRLLGGVRMSQARYADADASYAEAYARASELAARHPTDPEMLFERGQAEYGIGYARWMLSNYAEAELWLTRYRDSGAALAALDPARAEWQVELAYGHHNLAVLHEGRGELAAARAGFLAELAIVERMASSDPANLELLASQADAHSWLAGIAERQGDLAEAARQYATQVTQLDYAAKVDPRTPARRNREALALLYQAGIDMVVGRYAASGDEIRRARGLLDPLVAHDAANVDWKGSALIAGLSEAELRRHLGDDAEAGRLVNEALPPLEALWANEPSNHIDGRMLMMAWKLRAQLQLSAGQPEAAASAARAAAIADSLSQAKNLTDAEVGECARAHVVCGEVAAGSGDPAGARREWTRAADQLAPRLAASRDWRLLDPTARAAAWLGRPAQAQAAIETLSRIGYVPLDPWPGPAGPGAKISDPPPK
jgi:serine/threonine protein kinase